MASADAAASVDALYREVAALDSYEPTPRVMALFDRLTRRVLTGTGSLGLEPAEIEELRAAGAAYECRLEEHWSRRIATADDPRAELERFPLLVGGGPLPLSTLIQVIDHGWDVTVIDRDPAAVAGARDVADGLGLDLDVREIDGADVDYAGHDLIHVAALVGLDGDIDVLERIRETADPGTPLFTRTVSGRRRVLYPPLPDEVYDWFDHGETVDPPAGVVNSSASFEV